MISQNYIVKGGNIANEGFITCCENGIIDTVDLLLKNPNAAGNGLVVDIFAKNHLGRNAFLSAANKNQIEVMFVLKNHDATIAEVKDDYGIVCSLDVSKITCPDFDTKLIDLQRGAR